MIQNFYSILLVVRDPYPWALEVGFSSAAFVNSTVVLHNPPLRIHSVPDVSSSLRAGIERAKKIATVQIFNFEHSER